MSKLHYWLVKQSVLTRTGSSQYRYHWIKKYVTISSITKKANKRNALMHATTLDEQPINFTLYPSVH